MPELESGSRGGDGDTRDSDEEEEVGNRVMWHLW